MTTSAPPDADRNSVRGDGGYFTVAYVMLLAITAVGCLSLLIDGGRVAGARRQADLTAFQAARAATQQLDTTAGRNGDIIIATDANQTADATVTALLARAGLSGQMTAITVNGNTVTVTVEITRHLTASALFGHPTVTVTGRGTARAGAGVVAEETPP